MGSACAHAFAAAGCTKIALLDINPKGLEAVKESILSNHKNAGVQIVTAICDTSDEAQVQRAFASVRNAFPRLDYAVNCADIGQEPMSTSQCVQRTSTGPFCQSPGRLSVFSGRITDDDCSTLRFGSVLWYITSSSSARRSRPSRLGLRPRRYVSHAGILLVEGGSNRSGTIRCDRPCRGSGEGECGPTWSNGNTTKSVERGREGKHRKGCY